MQAHSHDPPNTDLKHCIQLNVQVHHKGTDIMPTCFAELGPTIG